MRLPEHYGVDSTVHPLPCSGLWLGGRSPHIRLTARLLEGNYLVAHSDPGRSFRPSGPMTFQATERLLQSQRNGLGSLF